MSVFETRPRLSLGWSLGLAALCVRENVVEYVVELLQRTTSLEVVIYTMLVLRDGELRCEATDQASVRLGPGRRSHESACDDVGVGRCQIMHFLLREDGRGSGYVDLEAEELRGLRLHGRHLFSAVTDVRGRDLLPEETYL